MAGENADGFFEEKATVTIRRIYPLNFPIVYTV